MLFLIVYPFLKVSSVDLMNGGGGANGGSNIPFEIPPETKKDCEKNISLYKSVAQEFKIPWQALAAIHYREANCNPNQSSVSGEDLGTQNPDNKQVYTTLEESLKFSAAHLKENAKWVYSIELGENPSDEELGWSFLAYNRGRTYRDGVSITGRFCGEEWINTHYDKSPYVVNFIDENHKNMHFNGCIDSDLTLADSRAGALTFYKLFGGQSSGIDECADIGESGETFDRAALESSLNEMKNLCPKPCYNIDINKVKPYLETFEVTLWDGSKEVKRSVTTHKLLVGTVKAIAEELKQMKFPVIEFGCFRTGIGGVSDGWSGNPSAHQMGIACDVNWSYNYGHCRSGSTPYSVTPQVAEVFKRHGFTVWGACKACYPEGSFSTFCDEMHFSTQDPAVPGILK